MLTVWNTKRLKNKLESQSLPEWHAFIYFFITVLYDHFAFTASYLSLDGKSLSQYGKVNVVSAFAITFLGVLYVYFQNGGAKGEQFFQRYFSLSVVIGVKFAILILAIPEIIDVISDGQAFAMCPWLGSVLYISLNITMFLFIGYHVKSLATKP